VDTRQPVLIMIQGPEPGSMYKLPDNRVTTIGRSSRNTIRVVTPSISRFHCELACVNGTWELNDLNSRKGTMVNGLRVHDRTPLQRGDIIRLCTTVFRFDLVDEAAIDARPMLAIKEAELDARLMLKGEAAASLDEIQARSRLERVRWRQAREWETGSHRTSLGFLFIVAGAVGLVVAALLGSAHVWAGNRSGGARLEARMALEAAMDVLEEGKAADAVKALRSVQMTYPDAAAAAEAARTRMGVAWSLIEKSLSEVAQREGEEDYRAALGLYAELESLHLDQDAADLVALRKQYTVRLAYASFRALEERAHRLRDSGELRAALKLYRGAALRIGVPELVGDAQRRAAELEKQTLR